jgi:hypothetical protein
MSRIRFTIGGLLAAVLFAAVPIAALREATALWDSGVFTVTAGLLLGSVLLAVHRTGRRRAFWVGFGLFGWAYLLAGLKPPVGSRLLTTKALVYLDSKVPRETPAGLVVADFDSDGDVDLLVANGSATNAATVGTSSGDVILWNSGTTLNLLPGPGGTTEHFLRVGHSILTLVVATLGGLLSRSLRSSGHGPVVMAAS